MRQFLNTLFVLSEDAYLTLDGENVVVSRGKSEVGRVPMHTLESILCFSYSGASPALMGKCGRMGIDLCFYSPRGRFLARTVGEERGNVLLRQTSTPLPPARRSVAAMPAALFWARYTMPAGCWNVPPGTTRSGCPWTN